MKNDYNNNKYRIIFQGPCLCRQNRRFFGNVLERPDWRQFRSAFTPRPAGDAVHAELIIGCVYPVNKSTLYYIILHEIAGSVVARHFWFSDFTLYAVICIQIKGHCAQCHKKIKSAVFENNRVYLRFFLFVCNFSHYILNSLGISGEGLWVYLGPFPCMD